MLKGADISLVGKSILTYTLRQFEDVFFILFIVFIGLFTILIDGKGLDNQGDKKDARLAKIIGISYIISAPILHIIARVF